MLPKEDGKNTERILRSQNSGKQGHGEETRLGVRKEYEEEKRERRPGISTQPFHDFIMLLDIVTTHNVRFVSVLPDCFGVVPECFNQADSSICPMNQMAEKSQHHLPILDVCLDAKVPNYEV